ncbi:hypothetical protein RCG23_01310 [Neobacillus sp. PS3-34]|uniref:hypothetical protein n=1 Tax=Neobacillus sp. PS3-34 TaxID=3070678 RepID=UPI0027DFF39E|nr:hypothetical protein [Neobacillus sp. PS3-34]WML48801.1 hypothetical protein RCG23_01310 [Neobacillus sp. PS3-34]
MVKRKLVGIAGLVVVIMAAITIYWFYFSTPGAFLKNEQMISEINNIFPTAAVNVIQDTIRVDEQHIAVPFISKENRYGLSYWAWQKHKWKVLLIETSGEPRVWKIDSNDPSTYTIVWNIHPDDRISNITFYLDGERNYHVTDGVENYFPKVQMEKKVPIGKNSYGAIKLPREWVTLMTTINKVESAKQTNSIFSNLVPQSGLVLGWTPYNKSHKEAFPGYTVNGGSYGNGNIDIDFIRVLSGNEIE